MTGWLLAFAELKAETVKFGEGVQRLTRANDPSGFYSHHGSTRVTVVHAHARSHPGPVTVPKLMGV